MMDEIASGSENKLAVGCLLSGQQFRKRTNTFFETSLHHGVKSSDSGNLAENRAIHNTLAMVVLWIFGKWQPRLSEHCGPLHEWTVHNYSDLAHNSKAKVAHNFTTKLHQLNLVVKAWGATIKVDLTLAGCIGLDYHQAVPATMRER